jgi:hypothetical protein
MSREDPQFKLRMPSELKAELHEASMENGRSLNAEILARLEESLHPRNEIALVTKLMARIEHLTELLEDERDELGLRALKERRRRRDDPVQE